MNPAEFQNIAAAEERMWWFKGMRRILDAMLDPQLQRRPLDGPVLEGGCGTGYQAKLFSARHGWRMYGLDLSLDGLRQAKRRGLERMVQGDLARLPFADAVFSAVIALDVLAHFEPGGEAQALSEMARVLAPGGLLVLRASALDVLHSRHSEFVHERQRFTRSRLLQAVLRQGFRIIRASYANSLLLPVALFKFRLWEPLVRATPASGVQAPPHWLNALLELPLRLESWWLARGQNLALGQSVILLAEKPQ